MKNFKSISIAGVALLALTGCIDDASDPDSGSSINRSQVSGVAVDGYIAGARVYADLNNNGRINAFEPQARTDEYGYFSFRPELTDDEGNTIEARDYCQEGPERFCLRVDDTAGEVRIRVQGGYDMATGLPFRGSVSGLVTVQPTDDSTVRAVTPLTSASSVPAVGEDDFWGRTLGTEPDASAALLAFLKHQSLTAVAGKLRNSPWVNDDDVTTAQLVAALYDALIPVLGQDKWWDLSEADIETVILDAGSRFAERDDLRDLAEDAAELLSSINTQVSAAEGGVNLDSITNEALVGLTRSLQAFLNLKFEELSLGRADALVWAWGQVLGDDEDACGDDGRGPNRIIIHRMEDALLDAANDYCGTRGSGSFPDLGGKNATLTNDQESGEEIELDFKENGELSLTGTNIDGLDEFADENGQVTLDGFWSQPTDEQTIITLTAFDGFFQETASITFVDQPDAQGDGDFVFSFQYLDDETEFSSDTNPFD